jgi:hypothetical protein
VFVILTCALLLVVAFTVAWRWRGFTLVLPSWAAENTGSLKTPARALVWILGVGLLTGLLVGVLFVGPAARLAMRLLAVTSPDARGLLTEAGEVVGDISFIGTVGVFIFAGLPFGLIGGVAYALASFVLPRGAIGGAVFGAAMFVCLGSRVGPLREENPDFEILGPGWLSVVTFCAMALLAGTLTAPIAARLGAALQTLGWWWALWMVPTGLLAGAVLVFFPVALTAVLVGCLVFLVALRGAPSSHGLYRRRGRRALQAALAVAVAIAIPGFVSALSNIASSSP